jgi:tryptophan-rich sensory protein
MKSAPTRVRSALALVGFILVTFCAPLAGMFSPPGDWYASLDKPEWNPPPWIFGPVWTALYLMMAVAAWLVWRRDGWRRPLWLYFTQLALNAAWTPVFFGAREVGWALVVILVLCTAILVTLLAFLRVSRPAGWMMVSYLAWVSFAAFLNFTLWRMNPG